MEYYKTVVNIIKLYLLNIILLYILNIILLYRVKELQSSLQKERLTAQIAQEQLIRVHNELDIRTQTIEQNTQVELAAEHKKSQVFYY